MCAIGGKQRLADISTDLRSAQHAWSACACALAMLQRMDAAIPLLMPTTHDEPSAFHSMTSGECSEAMIAAACYILKEDGMLGLSTELLHCVSKIQQEKGSVSDNCEHAGHTRFPPLHISISIKITNADMNLSICVQML